MKRILYILPILLIFACNSNSSSKLEVNPTDSTTVEFSSTEFDFGTIDQGEQVTYTFKFKNTGNKPLLISEVHTSCGCTASTYTKEPVAPQSEGFIKVTFNSAGKRGNQYKIVTVMCNTNPEAHELVVKGNVNLPTE
ncbi:MAG: DUF1573 domain-containing protein [Bacteroidales bacterium]|nr:DUF1573 domain-containing protein [Bacteroidales bacterium]